MARLKAAEDKKAIYSYCSWCMSRCRHSLVEHNYLSRNVYKCDVCGNFTVQCRVCDAMARDRPASDEAKSILQKVKNSWSSEYCAAHDGTIPSWGNLDMCLHSPDEFKKLTERNDEWNMVKVTGGVAGSIAAAGLLAASFGAAAGPLAAALGANGFLGAAGTGTAIVTLKGAALTSASLAAIGMGSMATGALLVSAAGGALGGGFGYLLSNNYLGELKDFDIKCVDDGQPDKSTIILLNGFLQKDADVNDWLRSVKKRFPANPKYHVIWDSKNLKDVAMILGQKGAGFLGKQLLNKSGRKILPAQWMWLASDILKNPWHSALNNAGKAGCILADILARIPNKKFIIMGHSLGCRVAYYAAKALATRTNKKIKSLYLLSGAVGIHDWKDISESVEQIYNCYAPDDNVVGAIYKAASVGVAEDTIGIAPIEHRSNNIKNFDVTDILEKYPQSSKFYHMRYKDAFEEIITTHGF